VLDGEVVIATKSGLDFDSLQLRLHPAASRVKKLAVETPSSFVAFDLLAADGESLMDKPAHERRARLEQMLAGAAAPLHLTPMTRERSVATEWLAQFEGAGLDGVIAKSPDRPYQPGKRSMLKIKHIRSADCVVAGFRWYKDRDDAVGSLLLGLFDDEGVLHHVGVTSSFTMAKRVALVQELEPLRKNAMANHPWRDWTNAESHETTRMPGGQSRWTGGQGFVVGAARDRARVRSQVRPLAGRPLPPRSDVPALAPRQAATACRYDQLEVTPPYELQKVFGA
jgi:ATP-dependent DNA ligase